MSKATKPPAKPPGNNVASINLAHGAADPPEGWNAFPPFGILRSDSTDSGRLVRLADLVRWLMDTRQIPRKQAVIALCDALPDDVMDRLYQLNKTSWATITPKDSMFGFKTDEEVAELEAIADKTAIQEILKARQSNQCKREW